MYLDARYVSASESIWRIFHYRLHNHTPNVQRLAVHLPNQQSIMFQDGDNLQNIVNQTNNRMTTLTAWFQENLENPAAQEYKYTELKSRKQLIKQVISGQWYLDYTHLATSASSL